MTGLILAMARAAGEVAAHACGSEKGCTGSSFRYIVSYFHPEREFMNLAYLVYDVGFQSPNSQAAKPVV